MRLRPILIAILVSTSPAVAQEGGGAGDLLDVHGFVSPGFIVTTGNNYLAKSKRGSFEFAEVGLNVTTSPVDRLRIGLQLFARDLGPTGDYTPAIDWFYLDYQYRDWLGLRAGRVKVPFGLYNETSDIDAARVPILLPQSTYPIQNRDFLLAQTGGELYGHVDTVSAGALEYQLYIGTIFLETRSTPGGPFEVSELTIPLMVGGRLLWEPTTGLRLGGSAMFLQLESQLFVEATAEDPAKTVDADIDAVLWVVSAEYAFDDWLLAAEYGRWHVATDTSDAAVFPETTVVSERAYAMLSYRVSDWFQPGAYYSIQFRDVDDRSGRANRQHDVAVTLRADINDYWLVKLEGHYLNGTLALNRALNDGKPNAEAELHWGAILVKTTALF